MSINPPPMIKSQDASKLRIQRRAKLYENRETETENKISFQSDNFMMSPV